REACGPSGAYPAWRRASSCQLIQPQFPSVLLDNEKVNAKKKYQLGGLFPKFIVGCSKWKGGAMGARWTLKALAYLLVITNLTAWAIADDALLVEDIESAVILEMHVNHLKAPIRSRVELERHLATGDSP